ncbi:MAG: hypothetical protein WCP55_13625, partial [Lentisphaerota bacterium]
MNTKRINVLLLFVFNILLFSLMSYSEEKYFYQTDFNNGRDGHPNGWNREGSGIWDEYGRSGKGLKISTWTENGRTSRWRSQLIKVEPGIYNIGVWAAQNIIYSQDPYYCAILAAVFYDNDKKEISKRNVVQMAVPPPRSRYEGALIIPEGLCWQYYSGIFTVPAGGQYLELVFAWSDFTEPYRTAALINGEVRIDDLSLVMGTLPDNPPPVIQSTEELPFLVSLSAPVDLNLFSVADPLEFTIFLYASNKKPLPTMDGLEINYQVSDYRRLELERGKTSARFEPYRYQERDKEPIDGWLATFILTDRQKVFEGRWLALEVAVECKGEQLGKGDIAFAVFRQDSGQEDDPRQFHFLRGTGGDKY